MNINISNYFCWIKYKYVSFEILFNHISKILICKFNKILYVRCIRGDEIVYTPSLCMEISLIILLRLGMCADEVAVFALRWVLCVAVYAMPIEDCVAPYLYVSPDVINVYDIYFPLSSV